MLSVFPSGLCAGQFMRRVRSAVNLLVAKKETMRNTVHFSVIGRARLFMSMPALR
jgi:hypothetical protein